MSRAPPITRDALVDTIAMRAGVARLLVAVAGPPGSGKSTLAAHLVSSLDDRGVGPVAILPMDGYHFDDGVLIARGLRARKGAPETFDVAGFAHMLDRLRRNTEPEVAVPVFDRDLEIARAAARLIPQGVRVLVVEGNYLLLDRAPWSDLHRHFDMTVLIEEPESVLRERLAARWAGYRLAAEEIAAKVDGNDLPNGRLVLSQSIVPDVLVGGE